MSWIYNLSGKKLIAIIGCVVIVVVAAVALAFYFSLRENGDTGAWNKVTLHDPSVEVGSVTPSNNSVTTSIYPNIEVEFSKPVPGGDRPYYAISLSPFTQGGLVWVGDSTLRFEPKTPLLAGSPYIVTLIYGERLYVWSFVTPEAESVSEADKNRAQIEADIKYSEMQDAVVTKYPWITQLPLQTDAYFVYFDTSSSKFIAKLYPATPGQTDGIKQVVIRELGEIGVDDPEVAVEWVVE